MSASAARFLVTSVDIGFCLRPRSVSFRDMAFMSTSALKLSRITLAYDVHEDRVLISGELVTGRRILLSLTRRC